MQLLCPHCHNPIEAVALDLAHETLCPSCGSTFRLDMGSTVTWPPSEGPGTLGPNELVGMVGTGELGSVYKAHGPELDRTVAIKIPHAGILVSDEDRKRFLREARNVAHLAYPSIVPVHEVGEHGGIPFLVSDFVEGVTFSSPTGSLDGSRRSARPQRWRPRSRRAGVRPRARRRPSRDQAVEHPARRAGQAATTGTLKWVGIKALCA